jgi:hypothetical protein
MYTYMEKEGDRRRKREEGERGEGKVEGCVYENDSGYESK